MLQKKIFKHCAVSIAVCSALSVHAQTAPAEEEMRSDEEPVTLLQSPMLDEKLSEDQRKLVPVFLEGDSIKGQTDQDALIEGNASLRKAGISLRADSIAYDLVEDRVRANGRVHINREGNVFEGEELDLKVEAFKGVFVSPTYALNRNDAHGDASKAEFLDSSHMVVENATYTTCKRTPGPDWLPDWVLHAAKITFDNEEEVGLAEGGRLDFKGVPILPVPEISFPLTQKRKSGFLPPTVGVDSVNGTELTIPYYWNIAPNRDATITPTLMTARGVNLDTQFRYLEPAYSGDIRMDYMPSDHLRASDRWAVSANQNNSIATGFEGVNPIGLSLSVNRVSDENYWSDFPQAQGQLSQRLLSSSLGLSWGSGNLSTSVQVQKWQTLQNPSDPVVPPYDKVPQLTAKYALENMFGLSYSLEGDFTQFEADPSLTLQPNAQRAFLLGQISRTFAAPAGYITPRLQLHSSAYQFDTPIASGQTSTSRFVPTLSVDSGVMFERNMSIFGWDMTQTLEPRAFYVYTPYHDQSMLPNYDTALADFSFASIFSENSFVGNDKIADNNLLTLGVSTRFLDSQNGAQLAQFAIAQRLRFEDQHVTLTPQMAPAQAGFSDILVGSSLNFRNHWVLDTVAQYNSLTGQSERSVVQGQYRPSDYRVFSAAYRFQRGINEQIDLSWQWPLNDFWGDRGQNLGAGKGQGSGRYYTVGRMNYSINDGRMVDSIIGVEYDAGCWLGRLVIERTQTGVDTSTQSLMFQLEFVGFTRLGLSPQQTLSSGIARYQNLRDTNLGGSRFNNYD